MAYMIDDVRNTVLTALNKENRGYLTPEQYNLYAKQAQMNIFNLYFSEYNKLVAMKNARRLSSEYGDSLNSLMEKIEAFIVSSAVPSNGGGEYSVPSDTYQSITVSYNGAIAEKITEARELLLGLSNMTTPSLLYPVYKQVGNKYKLNPYNDTYDLNVVYVRLPLDPVWTYASISGSEEPIFSPTNTDFQDFELPAEDAPKLVLEILKLAGITIRDAEAVQGATGLDNTQYQKENS